MSSLDRPTIPIRYLAEMAARSGASRAQVSRALAQAGLPNDALRWPRLRVSVLHLERYYSVLRRQMDDEAFGFFERKVPPGAYATLVRLLTGCIDVRSALDSAARFYRVFDHHEYWQFTAGTRTVRIELRVRDRDQAASIFFAHTMLIAPWRTAVWLSGRAAPILAIHLPARFRGFAAETRYLFGREPSWGRGPASLTLPGELFRRPVVREPPEADRYVATSLRTQVLAPPVSTLESELRALFFESKPVGDLSLVQAARQLGLSRASLARKLASHSLSFQNIKDEVRRDHAIALLTQTSQSIAHIAARVGYSAPSAFQRAFREWMGVSPGRLRFGGA